MGCQDSRAVRPEPRFRIDIYFIKCINDYNSINLLDLFRIATRRTAVLGSPSRFQRVNNPDIVMVSS